MNMESVRVAAASRRAAILSGVVAAVLLPQLLVPAAVAASTTATGPRSHCSTSCGTISFDYPFGVEPGCYHDGFNLTCRNGSRGDGPPKLFLGDGTVQVLEISVPNGTVRINSSRMGFADTDKLRKAGSGRSITWGAGLPEGGPYFLSESTNMIALVACDVQVDVRAGEKDSLVSSCTAICPWDSDNSFVFRILGVCSGIGCCQANIVLGYSSYHIQVHNRSLENSIDYFSVYIVDQGFNFTNYESLGTAPEAPTLLDFVISNSTTCPNASAPECRSAHSSCRDNLFLGHHGYRCYCSDGYQGNPYVPDGCNDIDECEHPEAHSCYGICVNMLGTFRCIPKTKGPLTGDKPLLRSICYQGRSQTWSHPELD